MTGLLAYVKQLHHVLFNLKFAYCAPSVYIGGYIGCRWISTSCTILKAIWSSPISKEIVSPRRIRKIRQRTVVCLYTWWKSRSILGCVLTNYLSLASLINIKPITGNSVSKIKLPSVIKYNSKIKNKKVANFSSTWLPGKKIIICNCIS